MRESKAIMETIVDILYHLQPRESSKREMVRGKRKNEKLTA